MFLHSSYPYPIMSLLAPPSTSRSSSHLYSPHIVFTGPSSSHILTTQNIYRDISNNLPYYFIRKSNITIIYQPKNIQYNILYKRGIYTNQKFGTLLNNLHLGPNSMKSIFKLSMTQFFVLYHYERAIDSTFIENSFCLHLVYFVIFYSFINLQPNL